MSEYWGRVTPKFEHVLSRLPRLGESGLRDLRGGELLAVKTYEGWTVRSEDDPSKLNPRLETIYLSRGREPGEPGLAFKAVERLSRTLYDTTSHDPSRVRGALLVAATWYYPQWDWYINRPESDENGDGFRTSEGMWGQITGEEFQAQGTIVVCDYGAKRESRESIRERARKIQRGGFPSPKDWSPTGRLPGDF